MNFENMPKTVSNEQVNGNQEMEISKKKHFLEEIVKKISEVAGRIHSGARNDRANISSNQTPNSLDNIAKAIQDKADEKKKRAYAQYEDALRRMHEGSFPVREGSLVFRVINGMNIGRGSAGMHIGDTEEKKYATPHISCVWAHVRQNDLNQYYYDRNSHDTYQRIAVIKVHEFTIPKPDHTHDTETDKDQVIVSGTIEDILTPEEFEQRFCQ